MVHAIPLFIYLFIFILCIFLVYYIYSLLNVQKKYSKFPGPEPSGLSGFLFGNLPELRAHLIKGIPLVQFFTNQ